MEREPTPEITAKPEIPEGEWAVNADWMRRALLAGGMVDASTVVSIAVEIIGADSGTLGILLRCCLNVSETATSVPKSVVVKLSSSDSKSLRIARTLSMYKREYASFRMLAPHLRVGLPTVYYGDFDAKSHRFVLVLEDLGGLESVDQVTGADAERTSRVIRSAAGIHGQFWNRMARPPGSDFLSFVGPRRFWLSQFLYLVCLAPCLERFGHQFSDRQRHLSVAFGPRVSSHLRALTTAPQTLTHGDFRLDNMFFGYDRANDFRIIDWQTAGLIGDGLYDVAYFMVSSVPVDVRRKTEREVLQEYHDVLCDLGVTEFPFDECWNRYRRNMLGMLLPCVCACGGLDMGNDRIRNLGATMIRRALTAIEDLDSAEFLPAGTPGSTLSSGVFRTYSLLYRLGRRFSRAGSTREVSND